jgi:hypothetical protein
MKISKLKKPSRSEARSFSFRAVVWTAIALITLWIAFTPYATVHFANSIVGFVGSIFKYFWVVLTADSSSRIANPPLPFDMMDWNVIETPISTDQEAAWNFFWSGLRILWNLKFFIHRLSIFSNNIQMFSRMVLLIAAFVPAVALGFKDYFSANKREIGSRSKPLIAFDRFEEKVWIPVKKWILGLWGYVKGSKWVVPTMILMLAYRFGLWSFVIDFFTYYLSFAVSWDFRILFKGLVSGGALLWTLIKFLGLFGRLCVYYLVFDWIRVRLAIRKLYKLHKQNMEFLDALGLTVMLVGPPGTGKTLTNSSMTRCQEEMTRKKLLKIILTFWDWFPDFDWMAFYQECANQIEMKVWNSALIDDWASSFYAKFVQDLDAWKANVANIVLFKQAKKDIFGYEFDTKPMHYYDELHDWTLKEAIETCAEAYFLYQFPEPLIESNFPQWETFKFTRKTPIADYKYNLYEADFRNPDTMHATVVMDFNVLRLSYPITDKIDPKTGHFESKSAKEFKGIVGCIEGVVTSIQETNKEWVNRNGENFAQCCKDGTPTAISIFRHACTIMNIPFPRLITDSQRLMDTNVGITSKFENELVIADKDRNYHSTLFLWVYTRWIQETLISIHDKLKEKFIKARKDQTLLCVLCDRLNRIVRTRYDRRRNHFWVIKERIINIHHTSITTSDSSESVYCILPKDDYSGKYATNSLKKDIDAMKRTRRGHWNANGTWSGKFITPAERKKMNSYSTEHLGIDS